MTLAEKIRQACMMMVERKSFQMTLHRDEWMQIHDALQTPRPEGITISEMERKVVVAALARLAEWEEEFPDGIDHARPPSPVSCELIQAAKALKASREPQPSDAPK